MPAFIKWRIIPKYYSFNNYFSHLHFGKIALGTGPKNSCKSYNFA